MSEFKAVTESDVKLLHSFYENCDYRLCEYSAGTKIMWRDYLHSAYCIKEGCLIIRNTIHGNVMFDYPVAGPDGDIEKALCFIESYCTKKAIKPSVSVVPKEKMADLMLRWPMFTVESRRGWQDYIYRAEDFINFAGRKYSGQRNHINKFKKLYPNAEFVELTGSNINEIAEFFRSFEKDFKKDSDMAKKEMVSAKHMFSLLNLGVFISGGIRVDGKLIAVCIGEICGNTLIDHVEKALYAYDGVYPTLVQLFAQHFAKDCLWINREDDAGDRGLRTSKTQYLPIEMGNKAHFDVACELETLRRIPTIRSQRLTMSALRKTDRENYNAICLDDERNRMWGYDYRDDLKGELYDDYFLDVAKHDFKIRMCVNFAVRLKGKCIGEAVLYNPDWKGGLELGCRIDKAYAGNGYGKEAFQAVAEWALYELGLKKVVAKCFRENTASYYMLSNCMRKIGEDEKYFYFEKKV